MALDSGLYSGLLSRKDELDSHRGRHGAVSIWLRLLARHASEASSILVGPAALTLPLPPRKAEAPRRPGALRAWAL